MELFFFPGGLLWHRGTVTPTETERQGSVQFCCLLRLDRNKTVHGVYGKLLYLSIYCMLFSADVFISLNCSAVLYKNTPCFHIQLSLACVRTQIHILSVPDSYLQDILQAKTSTSHVISHVKHFSHMLNFM